jgi:hypothetical protein
MYGFKSASDSLASAGTRSTGVQLPVYRRLALEIGTFTSGGTHYILGSSDASTYRRMAVVDKTDGLASSIEIPQAVSGIVELPACPGIQYLKVENTSGVANGSSYTWWYE